MAESQEFQVIVSQEDYKKLSAKHTEIESIKKQNIELKQMLTRNKEQIKDMKKSIYVRDSYIQSLVSQFLEMFGTILGLDIICNDSSITKSFYQEIVNHEQNGISSIQMRSAMDLFMEQNSKVLEQMQEVSKIFYQQKKTIKNLEQSLKDQKQISKSNIKVDNTQDLKKYEKNQVQIQKQVLCQQIQLLRKQIYGLQQEKLAISGQIKKLEQKNSHIVKQNEKLLKKKETDEDKSYVIKKKVDQYYSQLENNLISMGGLEQQEIKTVIRNQMKGIINYIELITQKPKKK